MPDEMSYRFASFGGTLGPRRSVRRSWIRRKADSAKDRLANSVLRDASASVTEREAMRLTLPALSVGILLCACEEHTTPLSSNEARARINKQRQEAAEARQRQARSEAFNAKPLEVRRAEAEEFWAKQDAEGQPQKVVTDTPEPPNPVDWYGNDQRSEAARHLKQVYTDPAYLDQIARDPRIAEVERRALNLSDIRFAAANVAYLCWRVGYDLVPGEYEVLRDAYVKHYFGKAKVIDELEFFDMIAAQFKASQARPKLTIDDETARRYYDALDSATGEARAKMEQALRAYTDNQDKQAQGAASKEGAGKQQEAPTQAKEDQELWRESEDFVKKAVRGDTPSDFVEALTKLEFEVRKAQKRKGINDHVIQGETANQRQNPNPHPSAGGDHPDACAAQDCHGSAAVDPFSLR
jgi:hypothetical protein